jgi:AraC-like DNA-binding protein
VQQVSFGDVGALDYVVASGGTIEDALKAAARYMRLVNDTLDVHLEKHGDRALLRLENSVILPRAAADFQLGALFWNYFRSWLQSELSGLTLLLAHPSPADPGEYQRTFAPARLRFSAEFYGFAFDAALLRRPVPQADRRLHEIIRQHAEHALSSLPAVQSVTAEVRRLVMEELSGGNPSAAHVARRLGMSTRTLGRSLEDEGTTFKDLLEEVRKRLALRYVASRDFGLAEVALLLGYSQTGPFHRAFRRWTGTTPLEYRKAALRTE